MLIWPMEWEQLMMTFAPLFSTRVWQHAQILIVGGILAPGKRTVTAALHVMGLSQETDFQNYHRVLNRAVWSGRQASRLLLGLLIAALAPKGSLVLGLDHTLERRRGAKIAAKGIYHDAVRSSKSHFVKASGLRWLSLMLLARVPWAEGVWALPFLTVLAPSERYHQQRKKRHKKLTDWGRQMVLQARRWTAPRPLVIVADSAFAAIDWLHRLSLQAEMTVITRLRLDAGLYEPAPPRRQGQNGRPRKKGPRLPTLAQVLNHPQTKWTPVTLAYWYGEKDRKVEVATGTALWYHHGMPPLPIRWVLVRDPEGSFRSEALLSTNLAVEPRQILEWFVLRWQVEVTFEEVRAHLGVETQRQWSDKAIARATPSLLALFSLVTLLADKLTAKKKLPLRQAAWYVKAQPTFSDAIAWVRQCMWQQVHFSMSSSKADVVELPRSLFNRMTDTLAYAA
jgi:DDE superfamily endonuclease